MDDREAFERQSREDASRMAHDSALRRLATQTMVSADRYNHIYFWRWLGLPIIQTPDDILVLQEIIWECRPQVIVETGFARGGSAILYSSILTLIGEGSVVSVDIDIREHNRQAVAEHPLGQRVAFVEGSSTDIDTLERVRSLIPDGARAMVVLDSSHTHDHVLEELRLYGPLVTPGQFLVVCDTVLEEVPEQTHRPRDWGPGSNPMTALTEYLREHDQFATDPRFTDKLLISSSPRGFLRRVGGG